MKRFIVYLPDRVEIRINAQNIDENEDCTMLSFHNGEKEIARFNNYHGWQWLQD